MIEHTAIQAGDAYIAREVLSSPAATLITHQTRAVLRGMVRAADLGHPLTTAQQQQLTSSRHLSSNDLAASLPSIRTPAPGTAGLPVGRHNCVHCPLDCRFLNQPVIFMPPGSYSLISPPRTSGQCQQGSRIVSAALPHSESR